MSEIINIDVTEVNETLIVEVQETVEQTIVEVHEGRKGDNGNSSDPQTLEQVRALDNKIEGEIDANQNKIVNLPAADSEGDATPYGQVKSMADTARDQAKNYTDQRTLEDVRSVDNLLEGNINAGGNTIENVRNAIKPTDVVPLQQAQEIRQDAKDYAQLLVGEVVDEAPADSNTLKKLGQRIDTLVAMLGGDVPDIDNVVDSVSEILEIFQNYPEGADIVTALSQKLSASDVVNTLTQTLAGKVLDARQGKVLKDLIDALTLVVSSKADLVHTHNAADITGTKTSSFISDFASSTLSVAISVVAGVTAVPLLIGDSIHFALWKLQAQITALAAQVSTNTSDIANSRVLFFKDMTTSAAVTGAASIGVEKILISKKIDSGKIANGSYINATCWVKRAVSGGANCTLRMYVNTANDLSGAIPLGGNYSITATTLLTPFNREFFINGGNVWSNTIVGVDNRGVTSTFAPGVSPIALPSDVWVIITATINSGSDNFTSVGLLADGFK